MSATVTELGTSVSSGVQTSLGCSLSAGAATNDTVIVVAFSDSTTSGADGNITDTKSNGYHVLDYPAFSGAHRVLMWYSVITTPLTTSDTVTFGNGSGDLKCMQVLKVTGLTATPLDVIAAGHGAQTTTTPDTGTSGTLSQADELAIAAYGYVGAPSFTQTSGWSQPTTTKVSTTGTVYSISVQYKETAATTAINPAATLGSSVDCAGQMSVFKVSTVTGPPVNTVAPSISGTAQVGQTLTANPGTWSPTPSGYSYRWQNATNSGGTGLADIAGATSSTYVVQSSDLGKVIRVGVIGNP